MSRLRLRIPLKLKLVLLVAGLVAIATIPGKPGNPHYEMWKPGDIVFLNGTSFRSRIVRLLQGYSSDYSHVGIVVVEEGVPYIVHADPSADRVVKQRWDTVIAPGRVSGGAVYRVRHADAAAVGFACATAERFAREGVPFDHEFNLKTADRLFCTELVWRAYRSGDVDLCKNAESEHPHLLPADLLNSAELQQVVRF